MNTMKNNNTTIAIATTVTVLDLISDPGGHASMAFKEYPARARQQSRRERMRDLEMANRAYWAAELAEHARQSRIGRATSLADVFGSAGL